MKNLKRSLLLLFIACVLFCFVTKTNASPARYFDIEKRGGDDTVDNQHHTVAVETPTQQVSAPVSTPNWSSKVQHREPGVIRLYSREWWMAVYGSVNGIQKHMIALGTFLILIGLFLCTMGFRQWQPALAVMGLLTFGLLVWIALANCRPERGYPNDTIVMIVAPICIGLVGAGIYFVFWGTAFYLAGALGGLAFALFICSWKSNLLIEHLIGRPAFLSGMAIVFAVGTYFVLRHFLMFATSFVGAYIIFLGIDCLARKGYIAAFERILNGNANSRVEYTVSNIVYVFLAMTLLLSLVSFGFQTWFNAKFDIVLVPAKPKEEPAKEEPAKKEESQGEGGGDGGSGSGDGGGDGDGEEEAGGDQEQAPSEKTKSKAPSAAPSAASTAASPSPPPAPAPPGPPPGTATTIHTTSARFIISPD